MFENLGLQRDVKLAVINRNGINNDQLRDSVRLIFSDECNIRWALTKCCLILECYYQGIVGGGIKLLTYARTRKGLI